MPAASCDTLRQNNEGERCAHKRQVHTHKGSVEIPSTSIQEVVSATATDAELRCRAAYVLATQGSQPAGLQVSGHLGYYIIQVPGVPCAASIANADGDTVTKRLDLCMAYLSSGVHCSTQVARLTLLRACTRPLIQPPDIREADRALCITAHHDCDMSW